MGTCTTQDENTVLYEKTPKSSSLGTFEIMHLKTLGLLVLVSNNIRWNLNRNVKPLQNICICLLVLVYSHNSKYIHSAFSSLFSTCVRFWYVCIYYYPPTYHSWTLQSMRCRSFSDLALKTMSSAYKRMHNHFCCRSKQRCMLTSFTKLFTNTEKSVGGIVSNHPVVSHQTYKRTMEGSLRWYGHMLLRQMLFSELYTLRSILFSMSVNSIICWSTKAVKCIKVPLHHFLEYVYVAY